MLCLVDREQEAEKMYDIGFDLGGTKMAAGLVDDMGKVISRVKEKLGKITQVDSVVEQMVELLSGLLMQAGVKASDVRTAGVAVPGILDRKRGKVMMSPNLGFDNYPLVEKIQKHHRFPIVLENDVNAGLWGEYALNLRQYQHVLGVFPGTGIGGGLIINGKLYRGASGNAGEVGHITLQREGPLCGCGQLGHLEALASRTAMAKDAAFLISTGRLPKELEEFGTDFRNISSKFFALGLKMRQPDVMGIIDRSIEWMGLGLASMINILDPEIVVLGGGLVDKLGDYYVKKVESSMKSHAMPGIGGNVKVVQAKLGDDAAIIGSALLAREQS